MANYQPLIINRLYAPNTNMGTLRAAVHERVLNEMLGSVNQGGWKVLVLDDLTTR
ncbi:hypothetical protein DUNSADRAFT_7381 [Dunaliella salina]|uniref:Uncharacterized protein n=1 Tax=Dunaliella salina TaxID=3046 RepID=A0ABQ7H6B8_DUNSA|nr:hypothetical protein DUNSADRAFT_7381 [Dunaliella salina]|eukprot:KAF5842397.1 hypothetical protein DUNSADRAFT_7381 [Dunaliella salina]